MGCEKKHRYLQEYSLLPDSQANSENDRHKCCGCAYVEGLGDALSGKPQATSLSASIPDSQAATVRHKDAMTAYISGYQEGLRRVN